jgi:hypothetical protein
LNCGSIGSRTDDQLDGSGEKPLSVNRGRHARVSMSEPVVSVVIPVYNGEPYLREAVESVLAQTLSDLELLIINDGSSDATGSLARAFDDPRVRVLDNAANIGLAATRNRGIRECRGRYLAWLDADDTSHPRRLELQIRLLESRPDIGACGTWVTPIGGREGDVWRYPTDPEIIRCRMLFDNPLAISSAVVRRGIFVEHRLEHEPQRVYTEDYDFWERLLHHSDLMNLPEVLTRYRIHPGQMSRVLADSRAVPVWEVQERQLNAMGLSVSEDERRIHTMIGVGWRSEGTSAFVTAARAWLHRIAVANERTRRLPHLALLAVLAERWVFLCDTLPREGFSRWRMFRSSPLARHATWKQQARLFSTGFWDRASSVLDAA